MRYIPRIVISPKSIDTENPLKTFFPYHPSPNRYAMDAFTVLFDITARRIVVAAMSVGIDPSFAHSLMAKFTASTSANHEMRPIK